MKGKPIKPWEPPAKDTVRQKKSELETNNISIQNIYGQNFNSNNQVTKLKICNKSAQIWCKFEHFIEISIKFVIQILKIKIKISKI